MKKNKNILIIAPYGFNDRMSNFVEFVLARLLAKNNWEVHAIAMSESNQNSLNKIYNINITKYKNIFAGIFYLTKIILLKRPNIAHIHNLRNNRLGIIAAIFLKFLRIKIIFTEYGLLHDHYLVSDRDNPLPININPIGLVFSLKQVLSKKANLKYKIKNYLFHWPLTHADEIVFVSRHNVPIAKELGLKNVHYLPQILDNVRWEFKKTDANKNMDSQSKKALEKLYEIKEKKYVLFIGQLKLRKGWDVFLNSIKYVDKNIIPYFAIVTSTDNKEPHFFSEMVDKLNVRDRLIFFGKIFNSEVLQKIFEQSEAVVVPSRYEGFGLVVTESWEMKKPLIATDIIAINENVEHKKNGLLFEKENAEDLAKKIIELVKNNELKNRLIVNGSQTLGVYKSIDRQKQWLDFYDSLI